ncbi:hypothetical protein ILYODFUR_019051 [Ilyodon furcidens]|uniref:C2H2-type domain-containing protein n=1 Tax=Ilyodon furcidens TaxID=33524 RepID=A0ABV0U9J0_9TELE
MYPSRVGTLSLQFKFTGATIEGEPCSAQPAVSLLLENGNSNLSTTSCQALHIRCSVCGNSFLVDLLLQPILEHTWTHLVKHGGDRFLLWACLPVSRDRLGG